MDTVLENLTLREFYRQTGDEQKPYGIPWIVWLLENPDSPLSFPGQIHLREHDYLHIIFGLDRSSESEAYLVGFAMGLDPKTRPWHLIILKFVSQWLYPQEYKFNRRDISILDQGFKEGKNPKYRHINRFDFGLFLDIAIADTRVAFGLQKSEPKFYSLRHNKTIAMSNSVRPFSQPVAHLRPP